MYSITADLSDVSRTGTHSNAFLMGNLKWISMFFEETELWNLPLVSEDTPAAG